ncbi:zingipain-2 [Cucumis melo var. makuwa]|uniref:Zingipain-2 n=1 Tax=Cucumis melo var. makuwa TaxID=1194695 RepID=A0A5A7VC45_CUCMM|nr:zingipain-2 [Cucumis melo var. makuwa]
MGNFAFHFLTLFLLFFRPLFATSNVSELFEIWCTEHGKSYSSAEEKLYRLSVFADNYEFVTHHNNLGNSSYTLSLNSYADLTHHEFKVSRLGFSPALRNFRPVLPQEPSLPRDVPDSLDWRKKGAVTAVKDQGSCACWSFSATGAIEGINQIMTGSLISVSEQELIDCDRSYNSGCGGGLMDYAYQFVISNHGIDTEDDYPYQGRDGSCRKDKLQRNVVTIDGYTDIPPNDEGKLLQAVAAQPVSVGICGSERAFQLYSKGIFSGPCSTSLDHAVLIVGYGSENGVDYWIVKNSWGKSWGMDGYMHMQRNSGNSEGVCGINKLASYPTKTSPNPPPSPPPGPTKCSILTSCAAGETCCCAKKFLGLCLSWKCCGLSSAVCCKDGRHCCPFDYPICDTDRNLCLKRTMNGTRMEVLENRSSSGSSGTWSSF